jgi:hypothetical protein
MASGRISYIYSNEKSLEVASAKMEVLEKLDQFKYSKSRIRNFDCEYSSPCPLLYFRGEGMKREWSIW